MDVDFHRRLCDEETLRDLSVRQTVQTSRTPRARALDSATPGQETRQARTQMILLNPHRQPGPGGTQSVQCGWVASSAARDPAFARYAVTTRSTAPTLVRSGRRSPQQSPKCPVSHLCCAHGDNGMVRVPAPRSRWFAAERLQRATAHHQASEGERQRARGEHLPSHAGECALQLWWLKSHMLRQTRPA